MRRLLLLLTIIALAFGSSPSTSSWARTSQGSQSLVDVPSGTAQAVASVTQAQMVNWVPWDWNRITSSENCRRRKAYLIETYHLRPTQMRCSQFYDAFGNPQNYWMVMIDQDSAASGSRPSIALSQVALS